MSYPDDPDGPLTLHRLQREVAEWSGRNFPANQPADPALGVGEELGELAEAAGAESAPHAYELVRALGRLNRAALKSRQGIRGDADFHRAKAADAVGDVAVYLADFCQRFGLDLQACVESAWGEVRARDWRANRRDGVAPTPAAPYPGEPGGTGVLSARGGHARG